MPRPVVPILAFASRGARRPAARRRRPRRAGRCSCSGALGVVYRDIGTSPLYTDRSLFTSYHATRAVDTPTNVYGVISLIFWALMVMVSIKYAGGSARPQPR